MLREESDGSGIGTEQDHAVQRKDGHGSEDAFERVRAQSGRREGAAARQRRVDADAIARSGRDQFPVADRQTVHRFRRSPLINSNEFKKKN